MLHKKGNIPWARVMIMIPISLALLLLPATALDCEQFNLQFLDKTVVVNNKTDTPPTVTDIKVLFNPCAPVSGEPLCNSDDHLCVVESIDKKTTAVKPFGSVSAGASEDFYFTAGNDGEEAGPDFALNYHNAKWGSQILDAGAAFYCDEKETEPVLSMDGMLYLSFRGPQYCIKDGNNNNPGKGPDQGSGSFLSGIGRFLWGVFKLALFLGIFALVLLAVKAVYVARAQERGSLPMSVDVRDILADLPYLLRDVVRKVADFVSPRRNTGYSAL